jgi:hypothetical protein
LLRILAVIAANPDVPLDELAQELSALPQRLA